ncbi:MAG: PAS domain S-box protein [Nitrospinae bacterium]|nr:PAS domain S-box protein [Nitrospinota bacterium]
MFSGFRKNNEKNTWFLKPYSLSLFNKKIFKKASKRLKFRHDKNMQMPVNSLHSNAISIIKGDSKISASVTSNTIEGLVVIDESGIIHTFNSAAEFLFGYEANEILGKHVSLLIPEPHKSKCDNYIQQYLFNGHSDSIGVLRELTALRKDGSLIPLELATHPVNLSAQRFIIGTIRNISERKEADARRDLMHNLTSLFAKSDDLEKICPEVLQTICEFMKWDIIFCWILDRDKQVLRCYKSWHSLENFERMKEFIERSYAMTFEKGKGLPGRVWESGEPLWIQNVTQDDNFPRSPFALKAGLCSGLGFPIINSNEPVGLIEVFSKNTIQPGDDITQLLSTLGNQIGHFLKRNELKQRLLKDQQNFFNMLDNLPVCFHLQAPDYSVPFANKIFRERFGNPEEGKNCFQLMHNRSSPCKICKTFDVFETNKTTDSIWTALDGRTYLTVKTPFQDIDGSKLVMEMAVDITEQKEAEKTNELFHQRLHKMVEGCSTAYNDESFFNLMVMNLASALQVNSAFIGEFVETNVVQTHSIWVENGFIENTSYPLQGTPCEQTLKQGYYCCPKNVQEKFPKDPILGDLKASSYMGVAFFDASEKPLGLLSVLHSGPIEDQEMAQMILEIFAKYAGSALERKKITDKLQKSYKNLETTNEELRDFVHIASHDLQEPLRKIISFGDLIKSNHPTIDDQNIFYLDRMEHSSRRLQSLVNDLVDFSTLDSALARKIELLDLSEVVSEVLMDFDVLIEQSNAQLKTINLPVLEGNRFQMSHLFQNLIGNALKYRQEGNRPSITIKSEEVDLKSGFHTISITDNGIGFDEKYLDRIFKPFQRLHRADEFEGTGMGLAICKKIIEQHNGTITAKSQLQKGTTFRLQFPFKQERV